MNDGLYQMKPDTYYTSEPVLQYSRIRRYRRPSLWRRFLWRLGDGLLWAQRHEASICYLVLLVVSLYFAVAIADAARSGRLGQGW